MVSLKLKSIGIYEIKRKYKLLIFLFFAPNSISANIQRPLNYVPNYQPHCSLCGFETRLCLFPHPSGLCF